MVLKTIPLKILILVLASSSFANDPADVENSFPDQSIGYFIGYASGMGFSYRTSINENYFWQATGGLIENKAETYYSIGASAGRFLHQTSNSRFYFLASTARSEFYCHSSEDWVYNLYETPRHHWIGLGAGMEFLVFDHLSIIMEVVQGYDIIAGNINTLPQGGIMFSW